jgi:hypothetical protein
LRVSRSGRSEPEDLQAAAELRRQAEHHAADNSGPKLIQVSLALDRLLETVADVAKDMRDEGTKTIRATSSALIVGSLLIAFVNLFFSRPSKPVARTPDTPSVPAERILSAMPDTDRASLSTRPVAKLVGSDVADPTRVSYP